MGFTSGAVSSWRGHGECRQVARTREDLSTLAVVAVGVVAVRKG